MIILAIDPGATSGWALFDGPRLYASGSAKNCEGREAAFDACRELARSASSSGDPTPDFVAAIESWNIGRRAVANWSPKSLIGMGAARGRWLERLAIYGIPTRRIVDVDTSEWRRVLAGMPRRTGEEAKASAIRFARAKFGADVAGIGDDEAEAICIGWWAVNSPEVAAVMPRRKSA